MGVFIFVILLYVTSISSCALPPSQGGECKRVITYSTPTICDIEQSCPICMEPYENDETISILSCGHQFKHLCLQTWLEKNPRCPMCNATS